MNDAKSPGKDTHVCVQKSVAASTLGFSHSSSMPFQLCLICIVAPGDMDSRSASVIPVAAIHDCKHSPLLML